MADAFVHDRATGITTRVSVSSTGEQANSTNYDPSISTDGRLVVFRSGATNLVSADTNGRIDIFVHDRVNGTTERVSVSGSDAQANSDSNYPSVSADGRYVAFSSGASNLVSGDTNNQQDVFVHDRATRITTRVSISTFGVQANNASFYTSISADGRYVAFSSIASNLVSDDTNLTWDVFVHDRATNTTDRVSLSSAGTQANNTSGILPVALSANGQRVAFESTASNLVDGDSNNSDDLFIHDRVSGETRRVFVNDSDGSETYLTAGRPSAFSADGRYFTFVTNRNNLVTGDIYSQYDVFIYDYVTDIIARVSVNDVGQEANAESHDPAFSADGNYVTFASLADNLIVDDTNNTTDIFVAPNAIIAPPPTATPTTIPTRVAGNCDEIGLDQALATGGVGEFNCTEPTTIRISSPKTVIRDVTLRSVGERLTISGGNAFRVFTINPNVRFILERITITEGFDKSITLGGGGLFNDGGIVSVVDSMFISNRAVGTGGAVYSRNGYVDVDRSTFANNSVGFAGGAISFSGGIGTQLSINNSTFFGNRSDQGGGALHLVGSASAVTRNSTFANNSAALWGSTVFGSAALFAAENTIFAHGIGNQGCSFILHSQGNNIDSGTSCGLNASGDLNNTDPLLGTLQDNGGPTWTMALLPGSPAIDTGNPFGCAGPQVNNIDQRGIGRPIDGDGNGSVICDIGAFEAPQGPPASPTSTATHTPTLDIIGTADTTETVTGTYTPSRTATATATATATVTSSATPTATATSTSSTTPIATETRTATATPTLYVGSCDEAGLDQALAIGGTIEFNCVTLHPLRR